MWTELMTAALIAGSAAPQQVATPISAPQTTPAPAEGVIEASGANNRASDSPTQIICQRRPVTGSLFNQRRCRTRSQADTARIGARDFIIQIQSGIAPPEEATLTPDPR